MIPITAQTLRTFLNRLTHSAALRTANIPKSKKYPQLQNCVENLDRYEALIFDEIEVNGIIVKLSIKLKIEKTQ